MLTLQVTSIPNSRKRCRLRLPDGRDLGIVSSPFHGGARLLLAAGFPPSTRFQVTVKDRSDISIRGTVGNAAEWTVSETDKEGLRYRRYDPRTMEEKLAA